MKSAIGLLIVCTLLIGAAFVTPARAAVDCGANTGQKATGAPIPIGAVLTMSGFVSFKEASDAVRAYFDCVNANGGIHGRPITYQVEDDQGQLDIAAQAAKKLVGDQGVYALIGSTSLVSCIANADYYAKENIVEIGIGLPAQCFLSKNIAEVNAGPRISALGAIDYAYRKFGIKSASCSAPKTPGAEWFCAGIEEWGKKNNIKVSSIYYDPMSADFTSTILQIMQSGAEAAVVLGPDMGGARALEAAQQQDAAASMKWTGATSWYTVRFPGAIDGKYWSDRLWVNAELAPLDSKGADNQNWLAVMKEYGGDALINSFSQAGYIAARVAVRAMLTIENPDEINRNTVTAAIQNMTPYETDILCQPWYWGGPDATEHAANHVTRTVTIQDGKWKNVEGCTPVPDPGLASIEELEKKLGVKINDQVPLD